MSRSQKVAFALLNKVGTPREGNVVCQGDRVSIHGFLLRPSCNHIVMARNKKLSLMEPSLMAAKTRQNASSASETW